MIPVTIVSTDSGTGEEWILEVDVPVVDADSVSMAVRQALCREIGCPLDEIPDQIPEAWVARSEPGEYAFIFRSVEAYFGEVLVVGIVYLRRG